MLRYGSNMKTAHCFHKSECSMICTSNAAPTVGPADLFAFCDFYLICVLFFASYILLFFSRYLNVLVLALCYFFYFLYFVICCRLVYFVRPGFIILPFEFLFCCVYIFIPRVCHIFYLCFLLGFIQ